MVSTYLADYRLRALLEESFAYFRYSMLRSDLGRLSIFVTANDSLFLVVFILILSPVASSAVSTLDASSVTLM